MRRSPVMLAALCSVAALHSVPAAAQSASDSEVEALRVELKSALGRIEALEQRLKAFDEAAAAAAQPISDDQGAALRGRGVGAMQSAAAPETPVSPGAETRVSPSAETASSEPDRKTPAPAEAVEAVAQAEQGYVGQRFTIEPGFHYSRFSNAQINLSGFLALDSIFLGLISVDETNADVLTADLTARYGLTRRLTFDANVPYIWRRSNFQSGGAGSNASGLAEQDVTDHGIGDVSFGVAYRLFPETMGRPDVVITARVKTPTGRHPFGIELEEVAGTEGNLLVPLRLSTGSGLWGASVGMSMLKTIDPMVVFGSITYFHNFAGSFDDISETVGNQPGRAKFGDAIQFGAGVAFALNEKSSLSASFTERIARRARLKADGQSWRNVVGSQANVGVLNFGATFSLSDRIALITNIGAGLTDDAPDMTVSLRLPYRF